MEWSKTFADFPDHYKTLSFADAIGGDVVRAVGHITLFRCQVARFAEEGRLPQLPATVLASWGRWPGKPEEFVELLLRTEILEHTPEGGLAVHDWYETHKALFDKRKTTARWHERKRRSDAEHAPNTPTVYSEPAVNAPAIYSESTQNGPRGEERRGEKKHHPGADAPATFASPSASKPPKPTDPRIKTAIDTYHAAHVERTGVKPIIRGGQLGKLIKAALGVMELDTLLGLVEQFVETAKDPTPELCFCSANLNRMRSASAAPPQDDFDRVWNAAARGDTTVMPR